MYVFFRELTDNEISELDPDIDFVLILWTEENWQALFSSDVSFEPISGI
jgi:hypothetical protein